MTRNLCTAHNNPSLRMVSDVEHDQPTTSFGSVVIAVRVYPPCGPVVWVLVVEIRCIEELGSAYNVNRRLG